MFKSKCFVFIFFPKLIFISCKYPHNPYNLNLLGFVILLSAIDVKTISASEKIF